MKIDFDRDRSLRQVLDHQNADELKALLALVPGGKLKAPRKIEIVQALEQHLLGAGAMDLWNRLGPLEQSAVSEAVHDAEGDFDSDGFRAKYGSLPAFITETKNYWRKEPTLLRLFLHPSQHERFGVPRDLREKLRPFIPKPAAAQLSSLLEIPDEPPRTRTRSEWNGKERVYTSLDTPLVIRFNEGAAIQDLRTVLRLVEREKLPVSAKTLRPSGAAITHLNELLHGRDYFPLEEKRNKWEAQIGAIKSFSWPLLVQAAKLASVRRDKLSLTNFGRAALDRPEAETLRAIWQAWLETEIIDEFSRIEVIKGQTGKAARSFTPPSSRRRAISRALAHCPPGRWVKMQELSRYMRAADIKFRVMHGDAWALYILDPQYGSLGYAGHGGWNIMEERYLLCLLFEYAAPLGLIDIAYEHPDGARSDIRGLWGTDDLRCLSRYDGLKYFRLTPLGAFILGSVGAYQHHTSETRVSLTVLPNGRIRIDEGELAPDQMLLLESFADREDSARWALNEAKGLKSVEQGADTAAFRAFLRECDSQPLPEVVEGLFARIEQRGRACVFKARALLLECFSPELADVIVRNARTANLCQRTGERGLVVLERNENAFREALNSIGYGMPLC